MEGKI